MKNFTEFSQWLDDYAKRCWSHVTEHVEKHDCSEVWMEDLATHSLEDCLEANKQLRGEDCPKFDNVSTAVAHKAFQIKRARFSKEAADNPVKDSMQDGMQDSRAHNLHNDQDVQTSVQPKYAGGVRAYKCRFCCDTGTVSIVSKKTIGIALAEMKREPKPNRFGISYSSLACSCRLGEVKRMDFARSKYTRDETQAHELYRKLPAYGDSDFHVHCDVILDAMVCGSCRQSKTLHDWDLVAGDRNEMTKDKLKCRNCGHTVARGEIPYEPRYMTLILHLHKVVQNIKPKNHSDALSEYTEQAVMS